MESGQGGQDNLSLTRIASDFHPLRVRHVRWSVRPCDYFSVIPSASDSTVERIGRSKVPYPNRIIRAGPRTKVQ